MKLLEVLNNYKNICWYPGSYFDFENPIRLSAEYVKNNKINYPENHDLFIFTDCCLNSEYLDLLNKGEDCVISFYGDAKIKNITAIDKIDIPFNFAIRDNDKTEYINRSWLFDVELFVDGEDYAIKVLYVVANAIWFAKKFLIENKVNVKTMIVEPGFDDIGDVIDKAHVTYRMAENNGLKYFCSECLPNFLNYDGAEKDFIFHNKIHNIKSLDALNIYIYDEDTQYKKYRIDRMFDNNLAVFINNKTFLIDFGAPVSVFKGDGSGSFGKFVVIDGKKYFSNENVPFSLEDVERCVNKFTEDYYDDIYEDRPYEFGGIIGLDILTKTGLTVMGDIVMFKPYDFKLFAPEHTINLGTITSDRTGEKFYKISNIEFENGKKGDFIFDGGYSYCQTRLIDLSDRAIYPGKDCNYSKGELLGGKIDRINAKCGNYEFDCYIMKYRAKYKHTQGLLSDLSKMNIDGLMPARFLYGGKGIASFDFKNNKIEIFE